MFETDREPDRDPVVGVPFTYFIARRLAGLRMPVKVLDADRSANGGWVVTARVSRSPARLVTGSGRQVRATRASAAVYRCTLVQRDGSWRVLRLVRS